MGTNDPNQKTQDEAFEIEEIDLEKVSGGVAGCGGCVGCDGSCRTGCGGGCSGPGSVAAAM